MQEGDYPPLSHMPPCSVFLLLNNPTLRVACSACATGPLLGQVITTVSAGRQHAIHEQNNIPMNRQASAEHRETLEAMKY